MPVPQNSPLVTGRSTSSSPEHRTLAAVTGLALSATLNSTLARFAGGK